MDNRERKYWLHRVSGGSNGWKLGNDLLFKKNILSIGWSDFSSQETMISIMEKGDSAVRKVYKEKGWELSRGRWALTRFLRDMKPGDYVVVPTYKHFQVFEIVGEKPMWADQIAFDLPDGFSADHWNGITHIVDESRKAVDLGFFWKVKPVSDLLSRDGYATADLTSRMKLRTTTADISNIAESVEEAISREKPINLQKDILDETSRVVYDLIMKELNPDQFERLVEWYLKKLGADDVSTPAKNSSPTEDGDADKVAYFEKLKVIILVQVKKHDGATGTWAVKQINSFDINNEFKGYTTATWVISSAKDFTAGAYELAEKNNVRLINGLDFAKLIMEEGIDDLPLLEGSKKIK